MRLSNRSKRIAHRRRLDHAFGSAAAAIFLGGGCYSGLPHHGDGEDNGGSDESGETADEGQEESSDRCSADALLPRRLRRLSDREYRTAVADLFPGLEVPAIASPGTSPYEFVNMVDRFEVDGAVVSMYRYAAKAIAESIVEQPAGLGCPAEITLECGAAYVETVAARAYRRPLTDDERTRLRDLYEEMADTNVLHGVQASVEFVLQSPAFLYRAEIGTEPEAGTVVLGPEELASAMSFFLSGTGPDAELLAAAEAGDLATREGRKAQLDRLLADPRVQAHLTEALLYWIGVPAIAGQSGEVGELPEPTKAAMIEDARGFVHAIVWGGGTVRDLLLSREVAPVPEVLADIYGVEAGATSLPADERAGILTRAGVIASLPPGNRIVHRGKFLRTQLLCETFPLPPDGALEEAAKYEGLGLREQAAIRAENQTCNGCHRFMDGPGFAFEHYDTLARWVDERDGAPVDASGDLQGTDVDGSFDDLLQLSDRLAQSERVATCVSRQLTNFALGALLDHNGSACGDAPIVVQPDTEIRALIRDVVMDPRFGQRAIEAEDGV